MKESIEALREDVATANRILERTGLSHAFGHASATAIMRAVASPIGWVRSHVVDRSRTPSFRPETGSCTGAAQHTQLATMRA